MPTRLPERYRRAWLDEQAQILRNPFHVRPSTFRELAQAVALEEARDAARGATDAQPA